MGIPAPQKMVFILKLKSALAYITVNSLRPSDAYMRRWTNHHCFRKWLVAWTAPSHFLNQCWNIVNWTLWNKFQWIFNRNSNIFIYENEFESVVCEMAAILSRPQCVKMFSRGHWVAVFNFFSSTIANYLVHQILHERASLPSRQPLAALYPPKYILINENIKIMAAHYMLCCRLNWTINVDGLPFGVEYRRFNARHVVLKYVTKHVSSLWALWQRTRW